MTEIPQDELQAVTERLARALNEEKPDLIRRVIEERGVQFAEDLFAETLRVEESGGLLTKDEKRRRTPGGVFLYLAKERMTEEERQRVFPYTPLYQRRIRQPSPYPELDWANCPEIAARLAEHPGEVKDMLVQLVGRPGEIVERRKDVVLVTLEQSLDRIGSLPYGMPQVPENLQSVKYLVFIAEWQWEKVQKTMRNPNANLHLKGYFAFDKALNQVVVFSIEATAKLGKKKLAIKEGGASANGDKPARGEKGEGKPPRQKRERPDTPAAAHMPLSAASVPAKIKTDEVPAEVPKPEPELPEAVKALGPAARQAYKRLEELRTARTTFERKLASGAQGFQASMTKKLLAQTVSEIEQIEADYPDLAAL